MRSFPAAILLCNFLIAHAVADDANRSAINPSGNADQLAAVIQSAIDQEQVVGAQFAIGTSDGVAISGEYGVIAPGSDRQVDRQTLFCIGSCSKPIVSALVMTLVDDGSLTLDEPISKWVNGFDGLRNEDGNAVERPPSVRELLSHRGGIYSQRRRLSPDQTRAIRDFRLTLGESVEIIARQPLIASPGELYQYSGAGYCVLGRVAEQISGQSIEQLLQDQLCEPLGLTRTTYFPAADDRNIATGGLKKGPDVQPHPQSPHLLGNDLRLPLVGGSIHSTAGETADFAIMILQRGRFREQTVLSESAFRELTHRQFADGDYGLGWTLHESRDGQTMALSHGGALYSARSLLLINLIDNSFAVLHWTLSDPRAEDIRDGLREVLHSGT